MKKIISVLLVIVLVMGVFAACGSGSSSPANNDGGEETSYYSWVGRFELYKWEMNGTILVGDDIAQVCHPDQYVILNKNGTGRVGLSTSSADFPLFVYDVTYSYDLSYQNGYMYVVDEGERFELRFEISGNLLTLEFYGAKMTFKKV